MYRVEVSSSADKVVRKWKKSLPVPYKKQHTDWVYVIGEGFCAIITSTQATSHIYAQPPCINIRWKSLRFKNSGASSALVRIFKSERFLHTADNQHVAKPRKENVAMEAVLGRNSGWIRHQFSLFCSAIQPWLHRRKGWTAGWLSMSVP